MLAQMPINEMGSWANLGAVGALICVVIYLVTKAIPQMLDRYVTTSEVERQKFGEILDSQRRDFRDEIAAQREVHIETTRQCHAAIEQLSNNVQGLSERMIVTCPAMRDQGFDG